MKFLSVDRGFINLEHVTKITQHIDRENSKRTIEIFYGVDGTSLGSRSTFEPCDFELSVGPSVAAISDEYAVVVWGNLQNEEDPDRLYIERPRIIAWIVGDYPKPIFFEGSLNSESGSQNRLIFLRDFGEGLRLQDDQNFDNLEGALAHAKTHFALIRKKDAN